MSNVRHFLDLDGMDSSVLRRILDLAHQLKKKRLGWPRGKLDQPALLEGQILALIFEKPSTRTRLSFDAAIRQLGGRSLMLTGNEMQLNRGESLGDTARVLSRMVDAFMIRTWSHETLLELARWSEVPVINGLTDFSHPCQIMADVMTFEEHRGPLAGKKVAWSGDGNNVAVSWIHAATHFGCSLALACPDGYFPPADIIAKAQSQGAKVALADSAKDAARDADLVVTDTWVSMNNEPGEGRSNALEPFRVDAALMALAKPDALFMHCLPAHRGEEVTADVLDGPQSVVFDEAENRLHVQKAILAWCFNKLD